MPIAQAAADTSIPCILHVHPALGSGQSRSLAGWEAALCITAGAKNEAFCLGGLLIACACKVSVVQLL